MESIYCLLLHEQRLVQGDHRDQRFLSSIDYHMRDLATILETTKWQLEDFERAVSSSAIIEKSQLMEDVISRHKQFIGAIREQINQVEKSLVDPSMGKFLRNSEWVNLNKQDRDGLELFLSGGNPIDHVSHSDHEDSNILKRFPDVNTASSSKDAGINEHESRETEKLKMNGIHVGPYYGSVEENNLRNVSSHYSARSGLDALDFFQETSCSRHKEDENWDLEANGIEPKSFFLEKKTRGRSSRIFGYLNYLWTAYESKLNRSYTKRLKDGEEERNLPSCIDVPHAGQGRRRGINLASRDSCFQSCSGFLVNTLHLSFWLGACKAIYERFPNHSHPNRSSIRWILALLVILTVLEKFQYGSFSLISFRDWD